MYHFENGLVSNPLSPLNCFTPLPLLLNVSFLPCPRCRVALSNSPHFRRADWAPRHYSPTPLCSCLLPERCMGSTVLAWCGCRVIPTACHSWRMSSWHTHPHQTLSECQWCPHASSCSQIAALTNYGRLDTYKTTSHRVRLYHRYPLADPVSEEVTSWPSQWRFHFGPLRAQFAFGSSGYQTGNMWC